MDPGEEDRPIDQATARPTEKDPSATVESVAAAIDAARARFEGRPVRDFVPFWSSGVRNTTLASPNSS
ncbi:hypothetical protein FXW78_54030 [Rhodococcus opacus]|nr:hypothetical protein [Rhodococcus opacus]